LQHTHRAGNTGSMCSIGCLANQSSTRFLMSILLRLQQGIQRWYTSFPDQ